MVDEDDGKEYRWETGYEKTWEAIKEDDEGFLEASVIDIVQRAKRKRQAQKQPNTKLGMMRHLYVILDCSDSMSNQDLKPTRLYCTIKLLELFIEEFFDQNPISQLGTIIMQNKRAEKISELSGNSRKHIKAIGTLTALKVEGVRCSIIGLAAEVHICKQLAMETNGTYQVILDDSHYKDLLFQHIEPPPAAVCLESSLIKMGFLIKWSRKVYHCPKCEKMFCIDCDIFIHDALHTCPGCATNMATLQNN
ncbi:hypothetical protein FQA39_LY18776 [Lamprigera yunnana]|nr:hypothetical protein FQA39_LY18776 [Lamprigera yunnana]